MTTSRAIQIRNQLTSILKEIKDDDNRYLVYNINGLQKAIGDFDWLIDHCDGDEL